MEQVQNLAKITSTFEGSSTDSWHGTFSSTRLDLNNRQVKDSAGGTTQVYVTFKIRAWALKHLRGLCTPTWRSEALQQSFQLSSGTEKYMGEIVVFILQNTPLT